MAYVYAYRDGQETTDTTEVTPILPTHESGDLLIVWWSKDDGTGGTTTISGGSWNETETSTVGGAQTLVGTTGNNSARGGYLWLVASSNNETPPTISSTDPDTWCWVSATIKGAPTTNPLDTSGTNNDTTYPYSATGVTTGTDNCLVFYSAHADGGVSMTAFPGMMNLSNKDSGADCCAVAWTFQATAGATGSKSWYGAGTADDTIFYCLAIKDGSSGTLLPVYTDDTFCTLITPNKGLTVLTNELNTPTNTTGYQVLPQSSRRAADTVYQYDASGPTYTDYTTAASNSTTGDVVPFPATEASGDAILIGDDSQFFGLFVDRTSATNGAGGVVVWEYLSNAGIWKRLPNVYDQTTGFTVAIAANQVIGWSRTIASDWTPQTVNSVSRYWVRARVTTVYTTNPTITQIYLGDIALFYDAVGVLADSGVNPFEGRLYGSPAITGTVLGGANFRWASAQDLSSNSNYLLTSFIFATPRDSIDTGLAINGGIPLILGDTAATTLYRGWVVGALDATSTRSAKWNVVGLQATDTNYWFTDSGWDNTNIRNQLMAQSCQFGGALAAWGHIILAGVTQIYGGSVDNPVTYQKIINVSNSFPAIVLDENISYQTIKFGGANGPLYCELSLFTLSFPTSYSDDNTLYNWRVNNQQVDLGIEIDAQATDTCKVTNGQISGTSWWKFDVLSTASSSATYDFAGLTLVGAVVTLRDITTFDSLSFINCRSFDLQTDVSLTNCTFTLREADTFNFTGSNHQFTSSTFNCASVASGSAGILVADPSIFSSCTFVGGGGHAVEITTPGTYTFSGNTFTSFGADASNSAAIYNNSSGSVTINITNGGSTPTIRNGASATTSIVTSVSLEIHVQDESNNPIEGAQVFVRKSNAYFNYSSHASNNASGDATFQVNEAIDTDLPQTGWLHVWDASTNSKQEYRYASWSSQTFTLKSEVTGSATSTGSSTSLISTSTNFLTADLEEGDTIRNTTDNSWAVIDEIIDADNLTTTQLAGGSDNTWQSADTFSVHRLAINYEASDLLDVPLFNGQTDNSGDVSTTYGGSVPTSIILRVRSNQGGTKYIPYSTSGTITSSGYSTTVILSQDTVAV